MIPINSILEKLSLDEKAELCSGKDFWHLRGVSRFHLPDLMVSDGPHGLRKQSGEGDHLGLHNSEVSVCFPTASALACSFHTELLAEVGTSLGTECQAQNVSVLLGPGINMKRSPLCGRNFEYYSEDPYLAGKLASSFVTALQQTKTSCCLKHYAVNNQETLRNSISAVLDERTLREIYLSAFEMVIKEAHPDSIMCSYNKINGIYASENKYLLTDILRDEWGFDGIVVSDWGAVYERHAGIDAGLDVEMPSSNGFGKKKILRALENGVLSEAKLNAVCHRVLSFIDKKTKENLSKTIDLNEQHKNAYHAALESMVLLKNDSAGSSPVLPLKEGSRIAVIGGFAEKSRYQGGGSSHINAFQVTTIMDQISSYTNQVTFSRGFSSKEDVVHPQWFAESIQTAKKADVAIIFAGLPESMESEGFDRKHMRLPECQNLLIRRICAVQPRTIVVLQNGSPVEMPWISKVPAVLESYLCGEACARAQLDLLFGRKNPSGKLAETFPLRLEDTPAYHYFPGKRLTTEHREGLYIGYRYYEKAGIPVLFPFGHGLSYTTFAYSDLELSSPHFSEGDSLTVRCTVTNTGTCAGSEVIQLYVGLPETLSYHPVKELKGFTRLTLESGASKTVSFSLDTRSFSFYHTAQKRWCMESGTASIQIGASSADIRLKQTLALRTPACIPAASRFQLPSYYRGNITNVSNDEFTRLLGFTIPVSDLPKRRKFTPADSISDARHTFFGKISLALIHLWVRFSRPDNPEMFTAQIVDVPINTFRVMGFMPSHLLHLLISLFNLG